MIGPMRLPLINWMAPPADAPRAPFLRLSTLWIQITGTWCNLECVHCIRAAGSAADGGHAQGVLRGRPLYHPACMTCVQTGMTCKHG